MADHKHRGYKPAPPDGRERAFIPLPADTLEDKEAKLAAENRLRSWVDEAYEEFEKRGGFDNLPGKGKPLEVPTGDVWESILKQANVPPPWILLRQEVKKGMEEMLELLQRTPEHPHIDELIAEINKQIEELNRQAPSLSLHRRKVTRETIAAEYGRWV
ncbi:DUF1992 domain-containing protein [Paenibacillus hamazuiensis]|uniref:DnaJ family domain-containing protein n=1 Tax=Paenibacillus hamazuiensis TaxID=2936508 RepID=UPI002010B95A|nr:DUF1992 domain-containing protein [Paenibacillus hamazuiensis]